MFQPDRHARLTVEGQGRTTTFRHRDRNSNCLCSLNFPRYNIDPVTERGRGRGNFCTRRREPPFVRVRVPSSHKQRRFLSWISIRDCFVRFWVPRLRERNSSKSRDVLRGYCDRKSCKFFGNSDVLKLSILGENDGRK